MKIDKSITNNSPAVHESQTTETQLKNFNDLKHGDKFKAVVTDITPGHVSLKLASGQVITAKSMILPEARIGEEAIFIVKENIKGQMLLEMLKNDKSAPVTGIVKEALKNAALATTKENINLATELIKNNLPLDKETLQKAAFFKYSGDSFDLDKILFLLREGFEATVENVASLNLLTDKKHGLDNLLTDLASEVLKITSSELRKDLIDILLGSSSSAIGNLKPEKIKSEIIKNLFIDITSTTSSEQNILKNYFKKISNTIANLITRINADDVKATENLGSAEEQVLRNTDQLSGLKAKLETTVDSLKFMEQINTQKDFMQIPFHINSENNKSDLYVFKDSKHKHNNNGTLSALIALDLAVLGHVECFISKTGKNVALNFKLRDEYVVDMVKKNAHTLIRSLTARKYTVSDTTFAKIEEEFSLVSSLSGIVDEKPGIRYAFDMRV